MINKLLMGLFNLIISLVGVLLSPIDELIASALPSVASGLNMVSGFFNWLAGLIPWGVSWFGFNDTVLNLFVAYVTFELTVPLAIHTVKLAIKWYKALVP